ncbi:MAG: HAD-IA family hydrolase [Eubacteriales bacterium]
MKYKTIIFDLDGTLIDSDYYNMTSLKNAINRIEERNLTLEEVKKVSGAPAKVTLDILGVTKREEVMEAWDEEFFCTKGRAEYFPGLEAALDALASARVYIGIVTSRERHEYDAFFSHLGLYERFATVVFASDTQNHKPHPEPILKFLADSGREKEGAIYIGDTKYDRDTAANAGIDFALAGWSLHDVPCERVLKSPGSLLEII